jgi:putative SOS response-associated peptidase YedK
MPVILGSENFETWLDPLEREPEVFSSFFKPFPADKMQTYPVSTFVNSPKNNSPQCIQAATLL